MTVLVVEREARVASFMLRALAAAGLAADHVDASGVAIDRVRASCDIAVVLLDLGVASRNHDGLVRALQSAPQRPRVIVLSTHALEPRDVRDLGADDHLPKPFRLVDLVARVRAQLADKEERRPSDPVTAAGARIDLRSGDCLVGGRRLRLSPRELTIVERLARARGQAVRGDDLLADAVVADRRERGTIAHVYVNAIRGKLGSAVIANVPGEGYRLSPDP